MTPDEFVEMMKHIGVVYLIGALITFVWQSIAIYQGRKTYPGPFAGSLFFMEVFLWFICVPILLIERWVDFLDTRE